MQRVANHRFLYRRGTVYYFRRAVPKSARSAFGGKPDVTISLQTSSLAEARHAVAARLREFDRIVALARRAPDPTIRGHASAPLRHEPSREDIEEGVRGWLREQEGKFLDSDLPRRAGEEALAVEMEQLRGATARGIKTRPDDGELMTAWIADHLAHDHGWIIPDGGPIRRFLINRVARAQIDWAKTVEAEVRFDPRPVPDAIFAPELHRQDRERAEQRSRNKPVSIMALFEAYCRESKPAPATVKAWHTCLRSLVDHLGHDNATKVTKSDVVAWKDALLSPANGKPGRSHNTISKKYLAAAKTVFGWAEQNLKIQANPTDKVRIALPAKEHLRAEPGLTDREATIILAAALQAEPDPAYPLRGFARRWIPWLCAYTGARVGEIAQLRAQDVFQHEDGPWCIRITPEAGSQKINRAREVPLHPHLIEQGFVDAVRRRKGPLFYDPGRHRGGNDGNPQYKKVAERLANWVRELGVTDPRVQPSHGWRHRFKRVARSARMDHEARDNIQGHAAKTEGDKYGGTAIQFRFEEICKLPRYEFARAE